MAFLDRVLRHRVWHILTSILLEKYLLFSSLRFCRCGARGYGVRLVSGGFVRATTPCVRESAGRERLESVC